MSYASIFAPGLFEGKVIIVTGGGSGIGRCVAHELASLGAQVALLGRKLEKLERVADEISQDGAVHPASVHVCDIRQEDAVRATVAAVVAQHGPIDGLVNNAGGQYMTPLEAISAKGWEAVVNTNLTGGFLMARECYTQSMAKNGGAIVNIVADMWGSMPGMGHSGAARAGMVSLTETAAAEWAGAGVRVNAVAPGWTTAIAWPWLRLWDTSTAAPFPWPLACKPICVPRRWRALAARSCSASFWPQPLLATWWAALA